MVFVLLVFVVWWGLKFVFVMEVCGFGFGILCIWL